MLSLVMTIALVIGLATASSGQVLADSTTEDQKLTAIERADNDRFGFSVDIDGDTMVVGAPFTDTLATDSGSAFVFVRSGDSWTQQAELIRENNRPDFDRFGQSVAISGDTIVVGAPFNNAGQPSSGSAYVFTRSGTTWTLEAEISAADLAANDFFGGSVAIDGDTIVAGARNGDSAPDSQVGSAYVFTRTDTTWTQEAELLASDGLRFDGFGTSVAISGDTIVAAAPLALDLNDLLDDVGTIAGAAYVFERSGTTWTEQVKLTEPDSGFASSVAIDRDTIVVGARLDRDTDSDIVGGAFVYVRGATWTQQAQLTAEDAALGDEFGFSVDIEADVIVVGANLDNALGSNEGSAYVFVRSETNWTQNEKLTTSDAAGSDQLGTSVAISGDTVVAGAPLEDNAPADNDLGAAYVFAVDVPELELPDEFIPEEVTFYLDSDNDTFGDPGMPTIEFTSQQDGEIVQPDAPQGFVDNRNDCNDADDTIFPGADEIAGDDIDQDCDGEDTPLPDNDDDDVAEFEDPDEEEQDVDGPVLDDPVLCNGEEVTVNLALGDVPTDGDDVILGTEGPDVINAGDGNDTICGEGGADTINAGVGRDTVFGGSGADVINAGGGRDTVYAQGGDDFVSGGRGQDMLIGGRGDDDLRGNEGADTILGGSGNDVLRGGQRIDVLTGGSGNDVLFGGIRGDQLDGGTGLDTYNGGAGTDTCLADPSGLTEVAANCER